MSIVEGRLEVHGSDHEEVRVVASDLISKAQGYVKVGEHLNSAKGLLYLIVGGALVASLCFIAAGIGLVWIGATGESSIELFGTNIKSANAGVVSIALGAVTLVALFKQAMQKIEAILRIQRGP